MFSNIWRPTYTGIKTASGACGLSRSIVLKILNIWWMPVQCHQNARKVDKWQTKTLRLVHLWIDILRRESNFSLQHLAERRGGIHIVTEHVLFDLTNPIKNKVRFSINLWWGIWKKRLVWHIFYEDSLTGRKWFQLLPEALVDWVYVLSYVTTILVVFTPDNRSAYLPVRCFPSIGYRVW